MSKCIVSPLQSYRSLVSTWTISQLDQTSIGSNLHWIKSTHSHKMSKQTLSECDRDGGLSHIECEVTGIMGQAEKWRMAGFKYSTSTVGAFKQALFLTKAALKESTTAKVYSVCCSKNANLCLCLDYISFNNFLMHFVTHYSY